MSDLNRIKKDGIEYGLADDTLRDLLFFKPGETVTLQNLICHGYIRGDSTNLYLSIVLPKRIDFTSSAKILSLKMNIRHSEGGYIEQESSVEGGVEYVGAEGITVNFSSWYGNVFNLKIVKQAGFLNAVNNSPVSVELNQVTFKFN